LEAVVLVTFAVTKVTRALRKKSKKNSAGTARVILPKQFSTEQEKDSGIKKPGIAGLF